MTVYIVDRTCYGEDYELPTADIKVFITKEKAEEYFNTLIEEETAYMGLDDNELFDELENNYLDHIDTDNDYRVVIKLTQQDAI